MSARVVGTGPSETPEAIIRRRRRALLRAGYRYRTAMLMHSDTGRVWTRPDGAEVLWWDGSGEYLLRGPYPDPGPEPYLGGPRVERRVTGLPALLAYLAEAGR